MPKTKIRRCKGNPLCWTIESGLYLPGTTDSDLGRLIERAVTLYGAANIDLVLDDESEARATAEREATRKAIAKNGLKHARAQVRRLMAELAT